MYLLALGWGCVGWDGAFGLMRDVILGLSRRWRKKTISKRSENCPGITTVAFNIMMKGIVKALKLTKDRLQFPFDVRIVIRFKDIFPLSFNSLDLWRSGVQITASESRHCAVWAVPALASAKRESHLCSVSWDPNPCDIPSTTLTVSNKSSWDAKIP